MEENSNLTKLQIADWWSERRMLYNFGLAVSGILAYVLYVIIGVNLIMPYDEEFEITLFTILFQGIAYLIMMIIANLFYNLGYKIDLMSNKENSQKFRKNLFNQGFWLSVSLPFLVPILTLMSYFLNFY